MVDWTVQNADPRTEVTATAKTELQTAGYNQAGGASVFLAAAAASALGSRMVWIQGNFLWAPSPPCSPVPAEEGTA